ncbi:hypothetical protein [Phoma matteucciicola RNA virus 1]|nr:hypothetical protein [Phoma matteucciicola RNA virus 1]
MTMMTASSDLSVFVPLPSAAEQAWSFLFRGSAFTAAWLRALLAVLLLLLDELCFRAWQLRYEVALMPMFGLARLLILFLDAWSNHGGASAVVWWSFAAPFWCLLYGWACLKWVGLAWWFARGFWLVAGRYTPLGWLLEVVAAWLLRSDKAPPCVLRAEDVNRFGEPAPVAHTEGIQFAQAAQVPHASVTAGGLTPARCRRRARWVCSLQSYLGGRPGVVGRLVSRRWVPDLPAASRPVSVNAVLAILDGDTKLLGGGVIRSDDPDDNQPFLVVERDSGREVVVPNLLGRLCRGTFGRERDASLLAQLRSRAVEWCSEHKILPCLVPVLVPGHVAMAMVETAPERLARETLEARGIPLSPSR